MSEGHIAPSRADRGSMGGKPPFAGVTRTGKDWNLNYVGFVAVFFAAPPIPNRVLIRGSTDGEPLL